jgi:hypothetical protein
MGFINFHSDIDCYMLIDKNLKDDVGTCATLYNYYTVFEVYTEQYFWDGATIEEGIGFSEVNVSFVYPCEGGGGTPNDGPPDFDDGGGGGGSTPDVDEDFDECMKIIGIETLSDIEAAREYHKQCGCNGFDLRSITNSRIDEINDFFDKEGLQDCDNRLCKGFELQSYQAKFDNIITPCAQNDIQLADIYADAIISEDACYMSVSKLFDSLEELSGGNYIVTSDWGNQSGVVLSENLNTQLENWSSTTGCTFRSEDIASFIDEELICFLINNNPDVPVLSNQCGSEENCSLIQNLISNEGKYFVDIDNPLDCIDDRINCSSFEFIDFGIYQYSQIEGVNLNFVSPQSPPKECEYEIQTELLSSFHIDGVDYDITSGMAAQAAARALSKAQLVVLGIVGSLSAPDFSRLKCNDLGTHLLDAYEEILPNEVLNILNEAYNAGASASHDDYREIRVSLEFDFLDITPTKAKLDWFSEDQCWN